ncbi:AAA family ATPase [uncultured Arthrobacter sp.]|uniref:AAA family ATPase n=1 Tax=uncultured Arthrobacter sp. TaxID=114050 RepID=UPI0025D2352A|nr:AAA family ATPase [uncultured Arthrobacter sp.]
MNEQRSDRGAEQALLAACLVSKTARVEARRHLMRGDFDDLRHEHIWDAMTTLDRASKSVDAVTIMAVVGAASPEGMILPELVTAVGVPDNVPEYAAIVRGWAIRRRLESAGRHALTLAYTEGHPGTIAARAASEFIAIRDGQNATDDITAVTVTELLAEQDDEPDWLIPGLLERRDRFMLTGEEGLGKSHLLRQFAVCLAAGIHPFNGSRLANTGRTLIVDCENTRGQVRRKLRPAVEWAARVGQDPADRMVVDCTNRMDITRDKDLARIHQLLDAYQPDLVVIGPLYRLVPRALQTDDDTAPVLAALDTIRDRGAALLMEAHAGHALGKGGVRDLRPRGSSSLLGWPEFGYGMKHIGTEGYADLIPWRGDREEREWPQRLRKGEGFRWVPHVNVYGYGEDIA